MAVPIQTELFYQQVMDKVLQAMKVPVLNEGHSEEILRLIRQKWDKHLQHALTYKSLKRREKPALTVKATTTATEQPPAIEANQSDSDPDDPEVAALFRQYKQSEVQQQRDREADRDSIPSDDDTNLAAPVADVELLSTCERILRKQTRWRIKLRHCIIESATQSHHILDTLDGNLEFIREE